MAFSEVANIDQRPSSCCQYVKMAAFATAGAMIAVASLVGIAALATFSLSGWDDLGAAIFGAAVGMIIYNCKSGRTVEPVPARPPSSDMSLNSPASSPPRPLSDSESREEFQRPSPLESPQPQEIVYEEVKWRDLSVYPYVARLAYLIGPGNLNVQEKLELRGLFDEGNWGALLDRVLRGSDNLLTLSKEQWIRVDVEDVRKYESFKSAGIDRMCQPKPREIEMPPHLERLVRITMNVYDTDKAQSEIGYGNAKESPTIIQRLLTKLKPSEVSVKQEPVLLEAPENLGDEMRRKARYEKQQTALRLLEYKDPYDPHRLVELITEDLDEENSHLLPQNKTVWREAPWVTVKISREDELKYGPFLTALGELGFVNPKYLRPPQQKKLPPESEPIDDWLSRPWIPRPPNYPRPSSAAAAAQPQNAAPIVSPLGKGVHETIVRLFGTRQPDASPPVAAPQQEPQAAMSEPEIAVLEDSESVDSDAFPPAKTDSNTVDGLKRRVKKKRDPMKGLKVMRRRSDPFLATFADRGEAQPSPRSFWTEEVDLEPSEEPPAPVSLQDFLSRY